MFGAVRLNNIDGINRPHIKKLNKQIERTERGSRALVHNLDKKNYFWG